MFDLKNISTFFQNGKGVKMAVALGIVGVLLIAVSEWLPKSTATAPTKDTVSIETYRKQTEDTLQTLLQSMQGVGKCRVYVTFANGVEYVYATEQKENTDYSENKSGNGAVSERADTQQSVVLVDGADGKTGLLLTEIQPQVKGVVIVCEGGGNATVCERVTQAVSTALNISSNRVCVTK